MYGLQMFDWHMDPVKPNIRVQVMIIIMTLLIGGIVFGIAFAVQKPSPPGNSTLNDFPKAQVAPHQSPAGEQSHDLKVLTKTFRIGCK